MTSVGKVSRNDLNVRLIGLLKSRNEWIFMSKCVLFDVEKIMDKSRIVNHIAVLLAVLAMFQILIWYYYLRMLLVCFLLMIVILLTTTLPIHSNHLNSLVILQQCLRCRRLFD